MDANSVIASLTQVFGNGLSEEQFQQIAASIDKRKQELKKEMRGLDTARKILRGFAGGPRADRAKPDKPKEGRKAGTLPPAEAERPAPAKPEKPAKPVGVVVRARRNIAKELSHGAKTVGQLAKMTLIPAEQLPELLDCDWFRQDKGTWWLTQEGRKAYFDEDDPKEEDE